jgi:FkbM family methyltransferase
MIKSTAAAIARKLVPIYYNRRCNRRVWRGRFEAMKQQYHEQELLIAPLLCDKDKTSIDVGAAYGVYTIHIIGASRDCLAFEPQQSLTHELREMAECLSLPIRVETVALSDVQGEANLRILEEDVGRSTIEPENTLEDPDGSIRSETTVAVRRLDDYDLESVGFIKIDVEGHEVSVLRGGIETIRRCLPMMLIEIEERHRQNSIHDVQNFLSEIGYEGYFLLNRSVTPINYFDLKRHQDVDHIGGWKTNWKRYGVYINNFFFVPVGSRSRLEVAVRDVRSRLSIYNAGDLCAS